jgi:hypothetical protein
LLCDGPRARRLGDPKLTDQAGDAANRVFASRILRNKAIKPLLAAAQDLRASRGAQNPRALDRHYQTIRMAMQAVFQELGLAA